MAFLRFFCLNNLVRIVFEHLNEGFMKLLNIKYLVMCLYNRTRADYTKCIFLMTNRNLLLNLQSNICIYNFNSAMNILRRILRFLFANRFFDFIIKAIIYSTGRNPLLFSYNLIGISKWQNDKVSGENYLIKRFLPRYFKDKKNITIFDIGANVGNYSISLKNVFPNASIYAFEPNPLTFKLLQEKTKINENIHCFKIGFSNLKGVSEIFSYKSDESSEHASLYKDVISDLHNENSISSFQIDLETLDGFCSEHKIEKINFVKIDTEGHEYSVLMGASNLIKSKAIDIIQFEFNEMNVISRIFLKDFYDILFDNYDFFRLDSKKLIPMKEYSTTHEIFQFQNIIAIKRQ